MGKDSKFGGKGKGKQTSGGDEAASKGKVKAEKAIDCLRTFTYVKARHAFVRKARKDQRDIQKVYNVLLSNGDKVPPAEFEKSQISSWRRGRHIK